MKQRSHPRGFMLLEMMLVLSLLAIFAIVATRLMVLCIRVPQKVGQKRDQVVRFDRAMARLRQDIWQANAVRCIDPHTIQVQATGQLDITWKGENGQIIRSVANSAQNEQWNLEADVSFAARPAGAEVDVREAAGSIDQIDMSSQAMLLERQSK